VVFQNISQLFLCRKDNSIVLKTAALIGLIFFGLLSKLEAQTYSFRNFNVEDGISHPFIYDILQDNNGYLWVATGEGLGKFNGFQFKNYYVADGLSENFVSTIYKDDNGRLWFGHNQGGCSYKQNGVIKNVHTGEDFQSTINAIRQDYLGNIWLLSQHSGLLRIDEDLSTHSFKTPFSQLLLFDFQITDKGQMLVATNEGLYLYDINNEEQKPTFVKVIEDIPLTKINCLNQGKSTGQYWVGTEDAGAYKIKLRNNNNVSVNQLINFEELSTLNIQDIHEDDENNLWLATFGKGLIQLHEKNSENEYTKINHFSKANGLGSNDIKSVYKDREGNIWVGKFGGNEEAGGISSLTNNAFIFYDAPRTDLNSAYYAMHMRNNVRAMGLKDAVVVVNGENFAQPNIYSSIHGLEPDKYTSVFIDYELNVWAGSSKNGLFKKMAGDTLFKPVTLSNDILSKSINHITGNKENLWVATKNGIYEYHFESGRQKYYSKETGLEHNVIKSLYLDEMENLWYSTASSYLSYLKKGKIVNIVISEDQKVHDQVAITKDKNGNIWLATNGSGIFIFDYESIRSVSAETHGLKSNFCYSIVADENNKIWVGHKGGLSVYNPQNNQIQVLGQKDGVRLDFQPNAISMDPSGEIWFGTNKKLVRYNPSKDIRNSIPPIVNLESVRLEDQLYEGEGISLSYGHYKAKFEFLGLSFKKSDEVTYQYILEGHDRDWQDVTSNNYASYSKIDPGSYVFKVVAFNSDGIRSANAAMFTINIEKPFWQKAWFILTCIAAFLVLMISIVKIRERRQRLIRQYLKKTLDMRTKEVQAKSLELEEKNKNITSSINYAKKIQDATLPDKDKLKEYFPESFILYQPRDIVSGDFYWFKQIDNKLLIAVADCTGHGVPGAFMSMIGSTMLSDIATNANLKSPNDVLHQLDTDLREVLRQTTHADSPQDGMDVVFCEIDLETRYIRMSLAMSQAYIASDKNIIQIKGDRNPIGGNFIGKQKSFSLYERQMHPGEILYLASDGYQDQFGGPDGKKLKRSGFISIIEQSCIYNPTLQSEIIENRFHEWKGLHDQIDDVLVVGIKF
jgi:ligand-binding sensor domain-containing protein/serine phosphatase RsbU (regulator of sigma subunit)